MKRLVVALALLLAGCDPKPETVSTQSTTGKLTDPPRFSFHWQQQIQEHGDGYSVTHVGILTDNKTGRVFVYVVRPDGGFALSPLSDREVEK